MTRLRTASNGKESEVAAFTRSLQSEREPASASHEVLTKLGRAFAEDEGKQSGPDPHIGACRRAPRLF